MPFSFADGLFWTSVACCAIAQLLIIRSALGIGRHPTAVSETAAPLPTPRGAVELFWTIVPAVALGALLAVTWRAVGSTRPAQADHPPRADTPAVGAPAR